jgi:hypothetical protein
MTDDRKTRIGRPHLKIEKILDNSTQADYSSRNQRFGKSWLFWENAFLKTQRALQCLLFANRGNFKLLPGHRSNKPRRWSQLLEAGYGYCWKTYLLSRCALLTRL